MQAMYLIAVQAARSMGLAREEKGPFEMKWNRSYNGVNPV